MPNMMLDERFWSKVSKPPQGGCWNWTANKNNKGYGLFRPGGTAPKRLAHRLSYENSYGPIPHGLNILHSCDNPACVNPAHLRPGTQVENVRDMIERGRQVLSTLKGEQIATSRLTGEDVIGIRTDYCSGVALDAICAKYGIQRSSIKDYTSGRSWKHLLQDPRSPSLETLKAESARRRRSSARLTANDASTIRLRLNSGETGRALAREYGVHYATISDIKNNRIWASESLA